MKNSNVVLAVVVTFNRLDELKVCVAALKSQSYESLNILVVNNGSTDGTKEWLTQQSNVIVINQENLGGAGGFYTGMKYMYDNGYEWLVMMDDDGIPDKNEIKNLIQSYDKVVSAVGKEVILNALVADKDDKDYTAFLWARGSRRTTKITELQKEQFFNDIHPFNGTLVKRSVDELKVCVAALKSQSYESLNILVVNNGSTDGTKEWLTQQSNVIVINQENLGGAGGFYTGMKYMYDNGYEWLVMMDDDGIPDKNEIKNLIQSYDKVVSAVGKEVILNALVADKDDKDYTAFLWARGSRRTTKITELQKEQFFNDIHPFNGTLVKRSVIEKIGMIKKEMFIWGDEKEYMARAIHNGIGLYTVPAAIHYHPKEKGRKGNIIPFISKYQILVKPEKMSHYYYRNEGFVYNTYPEKKKHMIVFCTAQIVYNITHFRFVELAKFIKYFREGMHNKY